LSDSRRATVVCAAFVLVIGGIAFAQAGAERTIRDQVYSETQAARGKSVYDKQCSSCHDGGMGPSLMGDDFLATWENKTVRTLYSRILTTMPSDEPGSCRSRRCSTLWRTSFARMVFPQARKRSRARTI
jgi:cytochrome c5